MKHGDGTYISEMHHRPFDVHGLDFGSNTREVMEARIVIEPPVSGLLARDVNGSDLDRVQEELDAAGKLIDDVTALPAFVGLGMDFHARLTRLCSNRILAHVVADLVDVDRQPLWVLVNQLVFQAKESRLAMVEEHQRVLDAVRADDAVVAEQVMRSHLLANKRQLLLEGPSGKTRLISAASKRVP